MIIKEQYSERIVSLKDNFLLMMEDDIYNELVDIFIKTDFFDGKIYLGSYSNSDVAKKVMDQLYNAVRFEQDYAMPAIDDMMINMNDWE